jgi:hypothetical protein
LHGKPSFFPRVHIPLPWHNHYEGPVHKRSS